MLSRAAWQGRPTAEMLERHTFQAGQKMGFYAGVDSNGPSSCFSQQTYHLALGTNQPGRMPCDFQALALGLPVGPPWSPPSEQATLS